ncbi:Nucleotide-binding universal stress protein, UspA family [Tistlia consotensis]|uniref:Nucleotide-binding universal stress protein, UspA family n=1 Tax=Tistlia consotensis USBA 355 TaxID=560819 RepID=A0A1Y6BKC9_9PROT|nr:universal stress protein [Tistlia consotensis]SMF07243.1 Nucleotide-binding universal stress protein, UspA family [Tistlia consotensis USBA 355]SNR35992.1 Nucleotide-binding universal stress protein, UspA family [Tistlia consotensis]
MFERILCCVDGSQHALRAAETACALAAKFGGQLTILTVAKELKPSESVKRFMALEQLSGEPQYVLDEYTEEIVNKARDVAEASGLQGVKAEVRTGNPARTIVEFAERHKADCIVLGSRGIGDIGGVLLGSVSFKVNSLAKCTVVTVKPHD